LCASVVFDWLNHVSCNLCVMFSCQCSVTRCNLRPRKLLPYKVHAGAYDRPGMST